MTQAQFDEAMHAAVTKATGCDDWAMDLARDTDEPIRAIYRKGGGGIATWSAPAHGLPGCVISTGRAHRKATRALDVARKVWQRHQEERDHG